MSAVLGILFDGVAFGGLLFLISVGLSVTLGVMNFVNLAHGAFALFGGYVSVSLVNTHGWPFIATLPVAFGAMAALGFGAERVLFSRLYRASPLEQVLLTVGLTFMAVAVATRVWGPVEQPVRLPDFLRVRFGFLGVEVGAYRLLIVAVALLLALGLQLAVERTTYGARLRAAVDHPVAAAGLGIAVPQIFRFTFALGTGLAGLGGALGADALGLEPGFAFKYLVYFLLVVSVGGSGSIAGTLSASILLGVLDVLGKYYFPKLGGFLIYALMVILLLVFPHGLRKR
jgi:branched-chain amino acid transport system permease protein